MVYVEVKINEKGQIVIPKVLRDHYGLAPGSSAVFVEEKNRLVLQPKKSVEEFVKMLDEFPKMKVKELDMDKLHAEELEERWSTSTQT